ncbi:hypothetical protein L6452_40731 [Arctium lappa]|uniref:Uncharacterized protein n=1 Tax=Arctium lappa TaxID=4217 RepID=A0ACB8XMY8_ARCLA|nr:hypothetical protein L6452_40731 [Arctium lappa]
MAALWATFQVFEQHFEQLFRSASESNEHHVAQISFARATAEEDVSKNSMDIIKHMEDLEPWRCRRTNGKNWRCSRKLVEIQSLDTETTTVTHFYNGSRDTTL